MAEVLFRVAYDLAWLPVVSCVKICGGGVSLSSTNFEGGGKHAPNTPITLDASTIPSPTIAIKVSYFVTGSYQLAGWIALSQGG